MANNCCLFTILPFPSPASDGNKPTVARQTFISSSVVALCANSVSM